MTIAFGLHADVRFRPGILKELGAAARDKGISRPLLVTDPGLTALGYTERCLTGLPDATLFDSVPENPDTTVVEQGLSAWRAGGCDGLIALGGGSPLDVAKAIGLLASHGGTLADFDLMKPEPRPIGPIPPLIAIPTTSGTGSELAYGCVLIGPDGKKPIVDSPHLIPALILCDPELTLSLPAWLTAATGMDALSHCIEAYWSKIPNPIAEAVALDGIARIAKALPVAVAEPSNIDARSNMMWGSMQGGLAMLKDLGAAHGLSVPLGERFGGHHGALTAAVLGPTMQFSTPAVPEKAARIANALGAPDQRDPGSYIAQMVENLGLESRLRGFGVPREALGEIAESAASGYFNRVTPRTGTHQDYLGVLEQCW